MQSYGSKELDASLLLVPLVGFLPGDDPRVLGTIAAVERELMRRRREGLHRSLERPHPEAAELAEVGLSEWGASLPEEDDLIDPSTGTPVRWVEGEGWQEETA